MKVTVVGAGNMGLAMTAYMTMSRRAKVTLFTGKKIESLELDMVERGLHESVSGYSVTADPEKAFSDADVIFVTYPAFLRRDFIDKNQEFIREGTFLGFVPGYGGAEYFCRQLIDRGVSIFGLQRVPYVARAKRMGDKAVAGILSSKNKLFVGAIPSEKTGEISGIIERLLDIPVESLHEYLSITLAPSNPLLHITGLYNVFKDYRQGDRYAAPLRFYEEWNDETSEILFRYDAELQDICNRLEPLDMSEVVPLPVYYESPSPVDMTRKLKSIESFKAVMVPLKEEGDGYIPDLGSRMFVEDYPYGVCIIKDFALMLGVETPTVDMLLEFYEKLSGHRYFNEDGTYTGEIQDTGVPRAHGLMNKEDIIAYYHR